MGKRKFLKDGCMGDGHMERDLRSMMIFDGDMMLDECIQDGMKVEERYKSC